MEMVETKHDLLTTKYTKVLEEAEYKYNAPHLQGHQGRGRNLRRTQGRKSRPR